MFSPLGPLFFLRLASNAFLDIGSVGRIDKKKTHTHKKSRNRRPDPLTPFLWRLQTTKREPNMAEKLVDVIAKFRQRQKNDQPPKLCVVTMLTI